MKQAVKKIIPVFLIDWYHYLLALLGAVFYFFPSESIKVIGITGTNGKSSTVEMISRMLEAAGKRTAVLSSIKFKVGDRVWQNDLKMTMPGRFRIQKLLRQAVKDHCDYAIVEVTSEGIKQHRHRFISFHTAIFTNLSPEHIEAHQGFENYRAAKGELFKRTKKVHIVNLDDENADYFLQFSAEKKMGFGIKTSPEKHIVDRFIKAENIEKTFFGVKFNFENTVFSVFLPGEFNIYNALAAISLAVSEGIDLESCRVGLERIRKIPGRMEEVISTPFKVIVDYAFTPNALEKVYQTIRQDFKPKKMICVLGACGGGRDKWKRPVLGELAKKYCDSVIVTNEDPYDENPWDIINGVLKGVGEKGEKLLDRKEAIAKAIKRASLGDAVVITGKGCEPWMMYENGRKIPWDDREIVREEFEKIKT